MSKIAVICNTLNDYHKSKMGLGVTLRNAGKEYDLFIWDNGSNNDRIKDLVKSFEPKFVHFADENVGNPVAYNQMLIRVMEGGYDYVAMIAPDLVLPNNWLALSESIYERCGITGFLGYDWGYWNAQREIKKIKDVPLQACDYVYGCWFFSTKLIEKIGYINEEYKYYGKWDSDLNFRINASGLQSYYLPPLEALKSIHLTASWQNNTEYRKFKNKWLAHNEEVHKEQLLKYAKSNNFFVEAPKKMKL